jgi:tetratricopeptide (TPR) repeat protein
VDHFKKGEYEQAVREFTEAIRLDPTNVDAYRGRWLTYCSLEDDVSAAADKCRLQELDPPAALPPQQAALSLLNQGNSYEHQGQLDKALHCYTEAIRLDPEAHIPLGHSAYVYRALLNEQMGQPAAAKADWDEAIRLNPVETRRARASFQLDKDDYRRLQQEAEQAFNRGDHCKAETLLRRLLATQEEAFGPEHPDTAQNLSYLVAALEAQGKDVKADPLFQRLAAVQLLVAIDSGDVQHALALLERGADPNARGPGGGTALMYAGLCGQTQVMKSLLDMGADPNLQSLDGRTALMHSITFGDPEAVRLLLSSGAEVNARNDKGETALTLAHARLSIAVEDRSGLEVQHLPDRTQDGDLTYATKKELGEIIEVLKRAGAR